MTETKESTLIHESQGKSITLERHISDEVIQFLEKIRFGHKDTTLYHKNTRSIILQMKDPYVFILRVNGQFAMTCLFSKRILAVKGKSIDAFYVRYLAADDAIHGMGTVVKTGLQVIAWLRKTRTNPTLFYSYVEESHESSYRFIDFMKFKQYSDIKTIGYSRVFPKLVAGVKSHGSINSDPKLLELLKSKFSSLSTIDLEDISKKGNYYTLTKNGKIIAGLRTNKANWVLNSLPGVVGKIAINLVPKIPLLNRIVNPSDWHFMGFDAMFCDEDNVEDLIKLMSSVLKINDYYSALMWLDAKDPLAQKLIDSNNLGLVYHFAKSSNIKAMMSFENLTSEEENYFKSGVNYISALDNL